MSSASDLASPSRWRRHWARADPARTIRASGKLTSSTTAVPSIVGRAAEESGDRERAGDHECRPPRRRAEGVAVDRGRPHVQSGEHREGDGEHRGVVGREDAGGAGGDQRDRRDERCVPRGSSRAAERPARADRGRVGHRDEQQEPGGTGRCVVDRPLGRDQSEGEHGGRRARERGDARAQRRRPGEEEGDRRGDERDDRAADRRARPSRHRRHGQAEQERRGERDGRLAVTTQPDQQRGEGEQSHGRRERVRLDREGCRARAPSTGRPTARRSRRRTPATRAGGGARRASRRPPRAWTGRPTVRSDAGAAHPREIEAPMMPTATTASMIQRRSSATSHARTSAATSAPRSTNARVSGRVAVGVSAVALGRRAAGSGRRVPGTGAAGTGGSIDQTAATQTTVTAAPTVASARRRGPRGRASAPGRRSSSRRSARRARRLRAPERPRRGCARAR